MAWRALCPKCGQEIPISQPGFEAQSEYVAALPCDTTRPMGEKMERAIAHYEHHHDRASRKCEAGGVRVPEAYMRGAYSPDGDVPKPLIRRRRARPKRSSS